MAVWDDLRAALARLLEGRRGALRAYPDPSRGDGGTPPYEILLVP